MSVDELVDLYVGLVEVVIPIVVPRVAPDPDDDVVIGTAKAAAAGFVVTGDKELLSVGAFESVRIISVSDVLAMHC